MARGVHVHRHVAVPPALEIVVAGAEERHGRVIVVEHALPGVAHKLQRIERAPVCEVSAHHHGVRAARLEETERLLVASLRTRRCHVDVAHHAERQRGASEDIRSAAARHKRRRKARENEFAPAHAGRQNFRICRFHHAGQYIISRPPAQAPEPLRFIYRR